MKRVHSFYFVHYLILIFLFFCLGISSVSAQKYLTRQGHIQFFSEAPLENIEANNHEVNCALDIFTGNIVLKVPMAEFKFQKSLMEKHFNENYVESEKYPYATFKGKVTNLSAIDFLKEGTYPALIAGELTIHGVTKRIAEKGVFHVKEGKISGKSVFPVLLKDYKIKIPKIVFYNIAEEIVISVAISLDKAE